MLVRRPTGGRALLHHREVTYSVTAPLERDDSVREWYAAINAILLDALHHLGVDAEPAVAHGRTPLPATASCFVRADEGEISVAGRKLVGSALLRREDALLQHGSILLDDDQALLERILPDDEAPPMPAGTLRQALGRDVGVAEVASALLMALDDAGAEVSALDVDAQLLVDADGSGTALRQRGMDVSGTRGGRLLIRLTACNCCRAACWSCWCWSPEVIRPLLPRVAPATIFRVPQ